jgi:hypothetical protein
MPDIPFMRAHGHAPGPTQRPGTAGLIDGLVAGMPAIALLWLTGVIAPILTACLAAAFALAGAGYGRIFGRAANDRAGGWLFGISYGFFVWMLVPALILPWILRRPLAVGRPAMLLCLAHLLYGLVLGFLFPYLHSLLHRELD